MHDFSGEVQKISEEVQAISGERACPPHTSSQNGTVKYLDDKALAINTRYDFIYFVVLFTELWHHQTAWMPFSSYVESLFAEIHTGWYTIILSIKPLYKFDYMYVLLPRPWPTACVFIVNYFTTILLF